MIIHLIASPRNVSTAFMYSMGQHSDVYPVDEPFYGCYLEESEKDHPGREQILESQSTNRSLVFENIRKLETRFPVIFLKNMAHHICEDDLEVMKTWKHCFLIRHPRLHIHSFTKVISRPTLEALGTTSQRNWYDKLTNMGQVVHIIDANQLLENPPHILSRLCEAMGIDFQPSMLSWPSGPKSFDGGWAPHWYQSAWESTKFGPPRNPESVDLPGYLTPLYEVCMVDYQYLYDKIKT